MLLGNQHCDVVCCSAQHQSSSLTVLHAFEVYTTDTYTLAWLRRWLTGWLALLKIRFA